MKLLKLIGKLLALPFILAGKLVMFVILEMFDDTEPEPEPVVTRDPLPPHDHQGAPIDSEEYDFGNPYGDFRGPG